VWTGIIAKEGHVNITVNPPRITRMAKVNHAAVSDGTSNTVAIMEKMVFHTAYSFTVTGSDWDWWDLVGYYHNADWGSMRTVGYPPPLGDSAVRPSWQTQQAQQAGRFPEFGFGSAHTGIMNAVFGDGSVRAVRFTISSTTLQRIGQRADGQVVD